MRVFRLIPVVVLAATLGVATYSFADDAHTLPPEERSANTGLANTSLYQLDSEWQSADGKPIRLAELRGKTRVVAIFYSNCQYACPVIIGRMKAIHAALTENELGKVGLVLVTMDPAVDNSEKLREYRKRLELEGEWTLLHGEDDNVRELAALLGFRYRQEKDGGYSHSNMITVLDREGRIAHQSIGLEPDLDELVGAVRKTLLP